LWQTVVKAFANGLQHLYNFTVSMGIPSYALAIIILTLIIKILLYPLTYKQMHSMKKMQELQPMITEAQNKYKKNPQKAQQVVMEIYKENNVNPLAGCLPLLIQMPILIALFQALNTFQYSDVGASFLWVEHLKNPDPIILPVIVAATTFMQTKLTSPPSTANNSAASTQKTMLYAMPLLIGYMSTRFPAGLSLYWIGFNVFGTLQQLYINKKPTVQKGESSGK